MYFVGVSFGGMLSNDKQEAGPRTNDRAKMASAIFFTHTRSIVVTLTQLRLRIVMPPYLVFRAFHASRPRPRVGSGQEAFKTRGSSRVGSVGVRISWDGSSRVKIFFEYRGSNQGYGMGVIFGVSLFLQWLEVTRASVIPLFLLRS